MRKMKDSGIEWIGEIPEEWETKRLRYIFDFNTGLTITRAELMEEGVPCINYGEIHSKYGFDLDLLRDELRCVDSSLLNNRQNAIVKEGDFIFCDTSEDVKGSGNCVYIKNSNNQNIFAGSHTIVARPIDDINTRYLAYLFSTQEWKAQIRSVVSGIKVFSITQNILKSSSAIIPPKKNQKLICYYLDKKCAQIDSVIKAKEKTNEKLKEYRQSIIYETVTKGLNKDVKMKDSGIEWIGKIAEGWEVKRLKYYVEYNPVVDTSSFNDEDEVSFVPMENLKEGYHTITTRKFSKVKKGYVQFLDGDILIAKVTPCLENGKLAIASNLINGIGFGSTEINVIRCKNIETKYLFYYFQNRKFIERASFDMFGVAGLKRLVPSFITESYYPIPTNEEQQKIANYLDKKCNEIDSIIFANKRTIEKLKEYRQSIIYEAVTGKVEV